MSLKMDPRVQTSPEGLKQQFELSMQCYDGMKQARATSEQIRKLRDQLRARQVSAEKGPVAEAISKLEEKLTALEGRSVGRRPRGAGPPGPPTLSRVSADMGALLGILQEADAAPTTQAVAACELAQKTLAKLRQDWDEIKNNELKAVNEQLERAKLAPVGGDS
jgi:hypothetical protein